MIKGNTQRNNGGKFSRIKKKKFSPNFEVFLEVFQTSKRISKHKLDLIAEVQEEPRHY